MQNPKIHSPSRFVAIQKYVWKKRLFKAMERYWEGRAQVAPLTEYLRKRPGILVSTLRVQSPEDLAWVQDPEGVMLGKYDFE